MRKELNKKVGYIFMFITMLIWGLDNVLFKDLLTDISPNLTITIRFLTIFIIMQIIMLFNKENTNKLLIDSKYKKQVLGMAIFLSLYYLFNTHGLNITKAIIVEFVGTGLTAVSTIIILAIFIKSERSTLFNKLTMISMIIALVGSYFTSIQIGSFNIDKGAILVIIGAIFFGLYTMIYATIDHDISIIRLSRDFSLIGFIIYLFILCFTGELIKFASINILIIFKSILISVIVDVGTVLTYYPAIRIISGVKASIIALMSPIISYTMAYIYLKERVDNIQLVGCLLVIIASIILALKDYFDSINKEINKINVD